MTFNKRLSLPAWLLIAALLLPVTAAAATDGTPKESRARQMLNQIDDLWRGSSSHAIMTMQVKTAHYTRNMRLEAWSKGKEKTLVRILSPLREKGTATLKSGTTIYTYLPRTDRTILLTSGMMMGSWMGSHFTNDDLVKESRMSEDYDARITFEGERDGVPVYDIVLLPKPDAPVVWGRIEITVVQDTLIPTKSLYYDEVGNLSRTMFFKDVRTLGGRLVPAVMELVPEDKPGEKTVVTYDSLELGLGLKADFFSRATLTRKDLAR